MVVDDWIARWCAFHGTRLQAEAKENTYRRDRAAEHGEFSFFSDAKRKVVLEGFVTGCLEKVEVRGRGAAHLLAHCAADCMTLISFQLARAGHEKEKVNLKTKTTMHENPQTINTHNYLKHATTDARTHKAWHKAQTLCKVPGGATTCTHSHLSTTDTAQHAAHDSLRRLS